MSLRYHEIAESNHRILNPFTEEKLILLGEVCRLRPNQSQLDLCCGKGEMLSRWARQYSITGTGVDISAVFVEAARQRAFELDVSDKLQFVEGDAAQYPQDYHEYDIVSCIGATWIGGGLVGTLELMKPALKKGGLLLVGEPYWIDPPPPEAYDMWGGMGADEYASLVGTLDRIESAGCDLVEMVLADGDSWDRYSAAQWMALNDWLRDNPSHPEAGAIYEKMAADRRSYLEYARRYYGWGVFVMRVW
jgi:SAM-dependent methyltransferase